MVLFMDPIMYMKFSRILYVHSILIMFGISTVKISIAFFLLRLSTRSQYSKFLYGVMIFICLMTTACAMTLIFQCLPVEAAWDSTLRPPPFGTGNAKCYSMTIFRNLGLMNSCKRIFRASVSLLSLTLCSFQHHHRRPIRDPPHPTHLETSTERENEGLSDCRFISGLVRLRRCHYQSCTTIPCPPRRRLDRSRLVQHMELH